MNVRYSAATGIRLAIGLALILLPGVAPAGATVAMRPAAADTSTTISAASPEPAAPAETPFVQTEHQTRPVLLGEGVAFLDAVPADQGWGAVWNARGLSFGQMLAAAAAAPKLVPIVIAGVALIVIASLARRRRRRRLGWGVLPERPSRVSRLPNG